MKNKKAVFIAIGAAAVLLALVLILKGGAQNDTKGITIQKDGLTQTASFFKYRTGGVNLEVLALRASDGSIRTAFNTCQVCYNSGRGYYKLDGNTLVCQNCSNRFEPDRVGAEAGGCNPVPITDDVRTDDGSNIVISDEYLQQAKVIFENWKG
jgi:uncharacterized membrane protein